VEKWTVHWGLGRSYPPESEAVHESSCAKSMVGRLEKVRTSD